RGVDSDPQTLVFTAGQENTPRNAKGQPAPSAARDASADQIAKVFIRLRVFPPNKTDVLRVTPFPVRAPTQ
ncbi:MAG TPA: hypothetical protein VE133_14450, partial [Candidatus Sulfotelmatobacter sp.]|nr:hypothetical protein [Candidatus Sulfotelmatobacter sp.]